MNKNAESVSGGVGNSRVFAVLPNRTPLTTTINVVDDLRSFFLNNNQQPMWKPATRQITGTNDG